MVVPDLVVGVHAGGAHDEAYPRGLDIRRVQINVGVEVAELAVDRRKPEMIGGKGHEGVALVDHIGFRPGEPRQRKDRYG